MPDRSIPQFYKCRSWELKWFAWHLMPALWDPESEPSPRAPDSRPAHAVGRSTGLCQAAPRSHTRSHTNARGREVKKSILCVLLVQKWKHTKGSLTQAGVVWLLVWTGQARHKRTCPECHCMAVRGNQNGILFRDQEYMLWYRRRENQGSGSHRSQDKNYSWWGVAGREVGNSQGGFLTCTMVTQILII